MIPTNQPLRNFLFHLIDGVFYMGGLAFTSTEIVLSVLIYRLGGSELAIGCVFALTELGQAFPQLLSAPFAEQMRRQKPMVILGGFLQRVPWLILGILLWFRAIPSDGSFVGVVLLLLAISFTFSGIAAPSWSEYVASTVPLTWRGRLFALRQGFTGVVGILAGWVVARILESYPFPRNFALLFWIAFALWMISLLCLASVRETPKPKPEKINLKKYFLRQVPEILRNDRNFRWFLVLKALMLISLISFGFFSVYGIKRFNLPPAAVGTFTSLYMAGQILCSFLFGYLADHYGHRLNILLFCLIVLGQTLLALFAPSPLLYELIFLLLGANRSIQIITFVGMPMEYAESNLCPTYFAMSYSLVAPFYLSGIVGGGLAPYIGYTGLFLVSAFFALLAFIVAVRRIRNPRQRLRA